MSDYAAKRKKWVMSEPASDGVRSVFLDGAVQGRIFRDLEHPERWRFYFAGKIAFKTYDSSEAALTGMRNRIRKRQSQDRKRERMP